MLTNYLKIAWRNLTKNKGYTIINIVGLGVGVCCFILISLFVRSELSYDKFHDKADRVYRVWQHENYGPREDFVNTTTPVSLVKNLVENYPEIAQGSRVFRFNSLVKQDENEFNEAIHGVDPGFFEIFDFPILFGNTTAPLSKANSIVLSTTAAVKYFGREDAIGEQLELEINGEDRSFAVTAVTADPPQESSIQYSILLSLENESMFFSDRQRRSWFNVMVESYVLLEPGQEPASLEAKFPGMIKNYLGSNYEEGNFFLYLQPLTEIHLDTSLPPGIQPISNPAYSYVLGTIGFLILLLACINFVTLAVGRSFSRATEVGIRKALGAFRKQIIHQFWGEALLITVMAVITGILLSFLFLDNFNELTGKSLSLSPDYFLILISLALILLIALLAGFYPSFVLSRFNPVRVLKGDPIKGASMGLFGKTLVIVQFAASIILLVGTLVIGGQVDFLVNKELGYEKEALVVVPTNMSGSEASEFAVLYIEELRQDPQVQQACSSLFSFAQNSWFEIGFDDAANNYREFSFNVVSPDFLKTHKIKLSDGRDFRSGSEADTRTGVIVNETFVKEFGLENPVGNQFENFGVTIVGVTEDFNYQSLNYAIEPLMMALDGEAVLGMAANIESQFNAQPRVTVRMNTADLGQGIQLLEQQWKELNPSQEFEFLFLDEALASQYQNEIRSKAIVNIAALLSIFIACMGLFGLATLSVARRTAEIGIRKVLGATVLNNVALLTKDFLMLILIAMLLTFPLAWWAVSKWLQDFAYTIEISALYFLLAGCIVTGICLATVSFQSVRASLSNPVNCLKRD